MRVLFPVKRGCVQPALEHGAILHGLGHIPHYLEQLAHFKWALPEAAPCGFLIFYQRVFFIPKKISFNPNKGIVPRNKGKTSL